VVPEQGAVDVVARLWARLPGLIDAGALPDDIVLVEAIPARGRTRKPDRAALRAALSR
jgi:hypothetical protein